MKVSKVPQSASWQRRCVLNTTTFPNFDQLVFLGMWCFLVLLFCINSMADQVIFVSIASIFTSVGFTIDCNPTLGCRFGYSYYLISNVMNSHMLLRFQSKQISFDINNLYSLHFSFLVVVSRATSCFKFKSSLTFLSRSAHITLILMLSNFS